MRLLIISRTPWNNSNSFGNTFSNLFGGIDNLVIYNICCQAGDCSNDIVAKAYQMTDVSVLQPYRGKPAGWTVEPQGHAAQASFDVEAKLPRKPLTIFYIARDMMWKVGRWWNADLKQFIAQARPDVIYNPIYASWYMCDLQQTIIDHCQVPVVGHISDDVYSYPYRPTLHPLQSLYAAVLRRKLRKLIHTCSYVEVFAENMVTEYSKIFHKPFHLIGKGIDFHNIHLPQIKSAKSDVTTFAYTGNIGNDRYIELIKLAKAIDEVFPEGSAVLNIYTHSYISHQMHRQFVRCKSLRLCGSVSADQVKQIQQQADVLVFAESRNPAAIISTRMSFSTKIIDYLMCGKLMLAIGPDDINSMQVLTNHNLAIVATTDHAITEAVERIAANGIDFPSLNSSIRQFLSTRHLPTIQQSILSRLQNLVNASR